MVFNHLVSVFLSSIVKSFVAKHSTSNIYWLHCLVHFTCGQKKNVKVKKKKISINIPVVLCLAAQDPVFPSLCMTSLLQSAHKQKYTHYIPQKHEAASPRQCPDTPSSEMQRMGLLPANTQWKKSEGIFCVQMNVWRRWVLLLVNAILKVVYKY